MSDVVDALRSLVAAEHAAVYGYGVLGARLSGDAEDAAGTAAASHRARRDTLAAALRDRRADVPAAEPAYDVVVGGRAAALALAERLEDGLCARWRVLVGATDDPSLRGLGLAGMQETAVRAAQWRRRAGAATPTTAFPGG